MKTTRTTAASLLPLLALLLTLPFALCSCSDAGDEAGNPTGPVTMYNPEMDYAGATISVTADPRTVSVGGEFDLIATFRNGDGLPVQGVALVSQAESWATASYFAFGTNPTLTNATGKASIRVRVLNNCPPGSYTFLVGSSIATLGSSGGPMAVGYAGVMVTP